MGDGLGVCVLSMPISREQDVSSKFARSQGVKSGLCPGDWAAAGDILRETHFFHKDPSPCSYTSVGSQGKDSGYGSSCGRLEEHQNPEDSSGTEHTDLPRVPHPASHNWRDSICKPEMRPRKDKAIVEIFKDALGAPNGSATKGTELPQLPDPAGHRQGEVASLFGQSESQSRDGTGEKGQDGSAMGVTYRKSFREYRAPIEWIRSHPVLTLVLIVLLALALVVSLAILSGRSCADTRVTSDTPLLLACPDDWVGYNRICYFLSRDRLTWDQAKAQCSELNTSLAVLSDKEMEFLFHLSKNNDYWLGLHRQGQRLQWVDGSNFNSSVPVRGNSECVHLADNYLGGQPCSNDMQYICSTPQTHL